MHLAFDADDTLWHNEPVFSLTQRTITSTIARARSRHARESTGGAWVQRGRRIQGSVEHASHEVELERLVSAHQTGEEGYLEEARLFVDRIMLFSIAKPTGIVFPGEELIRISTDYGTGSAG